jgi:hypothetical protein
MSDLFIIVVVAIWIFGAVNSIRKAIARSQAQAQAGGPLPGPSVQYPSGVRPTPAQRIQAMPSGGSTGAALRRAGRGPADEHAHEHGRPEHARLRHDRA